MKVTPVKPTPAAKTLLSENSTTAPQAYESVRQQVERALQTSGLKEVEQLLSARAPAPRDLLMAQIKISAFHLKVEFVSRAAESGLATLRKFQQGQ